MRINGADKIVRVVNTVLAELADICIIRFVFIELDRKKKKKHQHENRPLSDVNLKYSIYILLIDY